VEVTAAVNVAEKFPGAPPAETDQDAFLRDACARAADVYLSPVALNSTALTLIYSTVPLPSWLAGSHQVSCGIGATPDNRGWATLIGSAKGRLMINGQASPAPLNIPDTQQDAPRPPDQRPNTPPTPVGTPSPVSSRRAAPGPVLEATRSPSPTATLSPSPTATSGPSASAIPAATPEAPPHPDAPPVLEIPGLPPITLPVLPPPAPPPGN
jgi:hypothetical protein